MCIIYSTSLKQKFTAKFFTRVLLFTLTINKFSTGCHSLAATPGNVTTTGPHFPLQKSGKDAVAELQSSALPVSTAPQHGVFSAQLSFHPCFSLVPRPNKPSCVSQTFPNSSYSLHPFHSNKLHSSYSTKEKGKSLQHMPLSGA